MSCFAVQYYSGARPCWIESGSACSSSSSSPVPMATTLFKPWRSSSSPLFSLRPPPAPSSSSVVHCVAAAAAASRSGSSRNSIAHKRMDPISSQVFDGTHKAITEQTLRPCAAVQTAVAAGAGPFTCEPGEARPLGASPAENGINFALFSQHATSVSLCM